MSHYPFCKALGAFFLANGDAARRLLPQGLQVLEPRPQHAVFAITSFDFHESVAGPFSELVLSILVPPVAFENGELPLASFFPFAVATSTRASKDHNSKAWHLPPHEPDLAIDIDQRDDLHVLTVRDQDRLVLRLEVGAGPPTPQVRPYQCFTQKDGALFRAPVTIDGLLCEHEDERGRLELFDHPLADRLAALVDDDVPLREQTMTTGVERFGELRPHGSGWGRER